MALSKINLKNMEKNFAGTLEQGKFLKELRMLKKNMSIHKQVAAGRVIPGSAIHTTVLTAGEDAYEKFAETNKRKAKNIINNFNMALGMKEKILLAPLTLEDIEELAEILG